MIKGFIDKHCQYELVDIPKVAGIEGGRPQWAGEDESLSRAARLWPHRVRGEGHFVAKLIKKPYDSCVSKDGKSSAENSTTENTAIQSIIRENSVSDNVQNEAVMTYEELPAPFRKFVEDNLNYFPDGVFLMKGPNIYHLPQTPPKLDGLKTAKFGWFLGSIANNKFEPSHSLAAALDIKAFKRVVDLKADSREINSYLKGETLMLEGPKGLTAVCVDGYTVGWAKQTGDMLKNLYPKGWRRLS